MDNEEKLCKLVKYYKKIIQDQTTSPEFISWWNSCKFSSGNYRGFKGGAKAGWNARSLQADKVKVVITNICCEIMENPTGKLEDFDFSPLFEHADHAMLDLP